MSNVLLIVIVVITLICFIWICVSLSGKNIDIKFWKKKKADDHSATHDDTHASDDHPPHKPKEGWWSKSFGWVFIKGPALLLIIWFIIHTWHFGGIWDGKLYTINDRMSYSLSDNMEWGFKCVNGKIKCIFPDGRVAILNEDETEDRIVNESPRFNGNSLNTSNQQSTRGAPAGVYTFISVNGKAYLRIKTEYKETRYIGSQK